MNKYQKYPPPIHVNNPKNRVLDALEKNTQALLYWNAQLNNKLVRHSIIVLIKSTLPIHYAQPDKW